MAEAGETGGADDATIRDVENSIDQSLEDNPELQKSLQKSLDEIKKSMASADSSCFDSAASQAVNRSYDICQSYTDDKILCELQEAERQAQQTATIITELKQSVAQLLEKPHMTDLENIELEEKNKQLSAMLQEFEKRTQQIQIIVNCIDKRATRAPPGYQPPQLPCGKAKQPEDLLPKVIICGLTENNMPKIIICDADKKKTKPSSQHSPCGGDTRQSQYQSPCGGDMRLPPQQVGMMPQFARRLNESYNMQERLVAENADLEGKRYQLQEEIFNKDSDVDTLRQKVNCLQGQLRKVCKENSLLSDKLNNIRGGGQRSSSVSRRPPQQQKSMPCCPGKGVCPGDVESRLQNYSNTTNVLEKQLGQMEEQVRCMQQELENVQRERASLEQQKRSSVGGGGVCGGNGNGSGGGSMSGGGGGSICGGHRGSRGENGGYSNAGSSPCMRSGTEQSQSCTCAKSLRELREQYGRLQEDYKTKLTEVACLRTDIDNLKQQTAEAEMAKEQAECILQEKERDIKNLKVEIRKLSGSNANNDQEQQLTINKQKLREAQDEVEELRSIVNDLTTQLEDYRNKYLQAQQCVEEQRRQIDMMELENQRINDQVNLEIQRIKNQFEERIRELANLPDILKATQMKLQETQQCQICAEHNAEKLELELCHVKEELQAMKDINRRLELAKEQENSNGNGLQTKLMCCEKKVRDLEKDLDKKCCQLARLEEQNEQCEKQLEERQHEITQLTCQLEQLREECARQVTRAKERTDCIRRQMQAQVSELERQLAQSRAGCRSAQKERDEIRQKMQCQINNLSESFEQAQSRIRSLQGHVNFLKTSVSNIVPDSMAGDGQSPMGDPCTCDAAMQ